MERGWYFHPFYGFSLQNTLFLRSLGAYLAALALFAAIFWALSKRVQVKP